MKQPSPWSITGIPREVREVARSAAAREGITVGDWLTRRILAESNPVTGKDAAAQPQGKRDAETLRDHADLAARLARNEADIAVTIRKIDETLRELSHRIDAGEQTHKDTQAAMSGAAAQIQAAKRDQAQAFAHLIQRIEQGIDTEPFKDTLRGLHQGMSRLADQIAKSANQPNEQTASLASSFGTVSQKFAAAQQGMERIDRNFEERVQTLAERLTQFETRLQQPEPKVEVSGPKDDTALRETIEALSQRIADTAKETREALRAMHAELGDAVKTIQDVSVRVQAQNPEIEDLLSAVPDTTSPASASPVEPVAQETADTSPKDYLAQTRRAASAMEQPIPDGIGPATASARTARKTESRATKFAGAAAIACLVLAVGMAARYAALTPTERPAAGAAASAPVVAETLQRLLVRAQSGDAKAELLLGLRLADGDGGTANETEAASWLQKAAESGEALAQYRLATLYESGRGVPKDSKQAASWYLAAAKLGNRRAMHNLAAAYTNGAGVAKDLAEAARWFRAAADLGFTASQFNLAVLYERGLGVPESRARAYEWYAIAAAAGDGEAQKRLAAVAAQLPPTEKSAAERNAKAFKAEPWDPEANAMPALALAAP